MSACRLLLMMSSLLICLWAEMKLNRKLLFFLMHVNAMTAGSAELCSTMLFMNRSIIQLACTVNSKLFFGSKKYEFLNNIELFFFFMFNKTIYCSIVKLCL